MQKDLIIKDYIEKLSSREAVPGGGSAAALAGALSSALTSMVFNLTVGKKLFEEYNDEEKNKIYKCIEKIEKYNDEFLELMDKDGEAFLSLMLSFKLPKETEKEKQIRRESVNEGYENALRIPLTLAEKCLDLYECVFVAAKYGSKNVISDAGVAAILLKSSIESSILNVNINLQGIKDDEYRNRIIKGCDRILNEASQKKVEIMKIVNAKIA